MRSHQKVVPFWKMKDFSRFGGLFMKMNSFQGNQNSRIRNSRLPRWSLELTETRKIVNFVQNHLFSVSELFRIGPPGARHAWTNQRRRKSWNEEDLPQLCMRKQAVISNTIEDCAMCHMGRNTLYIWLTSSVKVPPLYLPKAILRTCSTSWSEHPLSKVLK